jgi:hypothetical protein
MLGTGSRRIVGRSGKRHAPPMSAPISHRLPPEEKLDLLRTLDEFRFWYSLDDRRRCQRCHRSITGRQVEIIPIGAGKARLQCPTENCLSSPGEWSYADPVSVAKQLTFG